MQMTLSVRDMARLVGLCKFSDCLLDYENILYLLDESSCFSPFVPGTAKEVYWNSTLRKAAVEVVGSLADYSNCY